MFSHGTLSNLSMGLPILTKIQPTNTPFRLIRLMRFSMKPLRSLLVFLALSNFFSIPLRADEVVIVVNKQNPTEDISSKDVKKIFRFEKQFWDHGGKISPLLRETGSSAKTLMLKKIYEMSDEDLKKLLLLRLFKGEIAALPQTLDSDTAVKKFVSQIPNAIGYINRASSDSNVKTLRIDGKLPGDPGYLLTDSEP